MVPPGKGVTVMSIPVGVPPAVGGPACHVNRSPASNVLGADMEAGCKPWNVFRNVHPGESAAAGAAVASAAPASAATRVTKQSANRAGRARCRSDRSVIKVLLVGLRLASTLHTPADQTAPFSLRRWKARRTL